MSDTHRVGEILSALRRVMRAVDLHSRSLVQSHGLTGPQALILKAVYEEPLIAGVLAERISLSQATVTDILNRLEHRGLITRIRSEEDRRRVIVEATVAGKALVETSPPLLQERFAKRFEELADWEQTTLLASVQRIASMMDAEDLDAAPLLSIGSVTAAPEVTEGGVRGDGDEETVAVDK